MHFGPVAPANVEQLAQQRTPIILDADALLLRPAAFATAALLLYTLLGVLIFRFSSLRLSWICAFYFAITTTTTVGYGDLNPAVARVNGTGFPGSSAYEPTDGMLLLTALYILGGVGVIGTALGLLMQAVLDGADGLCKKSYALWLSFAYVAFVLAMGTIAMVYLEGWSVAKAFYWATVTVSTVGYGGEVPSSNASRGFAAVFMLVGVGGTAKLFADLAALPLQRYRGKLEERVLHQYGDSLQEDELWELAAGEQMQSFGLSSSLSYVTKNEFCLGMLLRMEKLQIEDLQRCQHAFDRLDVTRTGRLDMHDIREHTHHSHDHAAPQGTTHAPPQQPHDGQGPHAAANGGKARRSLSRATTSPCVSQSHATPLQTDDARLSLSQWLWQGRGTGNGPEEGGTPAPRSGA